MDSACLALTRIAEAFSRSPSHLEKLCELGLIGSIVQMVGVSESGSMTSQLQVRAGAPACQQGGGKARQHAALQPGCCWGGCGMRSLCGLPPCAANRHRLRDPYWQPPCLQVSTFYGLLKILATMAGGSHVVAEALLQVVRLLYWLAH